MRALTLVLSLLTIILASLEFTSVTSLTSNSRTPASEAASPNRYSCRIITGYGTAIGYGTSKLLAKEKAREICGEKIIDGYIAQRGSIPDDVVADLTTACINEECQ